MWIKLIHTHFTSHYYAFHFLKFQQEYLTRVLCTFFFQRIKKTIYDAFSYLPHDFNIVWLWWCSHTLNQISASFLCLAFFFHILKSCTVRLLKRLFEINYTPFAKKKIHKTLPSLFNSSMHRDPSYLLYSIFYPETRTTTTILEYFSRNHEFQAHLICNFTTFTCVSFITTTTTTKKWL